MTEHFQQFHVRFMLLLCCLMPFHIYRYLLLFFLLLICRFAKQKTKLLILFQAPWMREILSPVSSFCKMSRQWKKGSLFHVITSMSRLTLFHFVERRLHAWIYMWKCVRICECCHFHRFVFVCWYVCVPTSYRMWMNKAKSFTNAFLHVKLYP